MITFLCGFLSGVIASMIFLIVAEMCRAPRFDEDPACTERGDRGVPRGEEIKP